jgi:hypothetical protein
MFGKAATERVSRFKEQALNDQNGDDSSSPKKTHLNPFNCQIMDEAPRDPTKLVYGPDSW